MSIYAYKNELKWRGGSHRWKTISTLYAGIKKFIVMAKFCEDIDAEICIDTQLSVEASLSRSDNEMEFEDGTNESGHKQTEQNWASLWWTNHVFCQESSIASRNKLVILNRTYIKEKVFIWTMYAKGYITKPFSCHHHSLNMKKTARNPTLHCIKDHRMFE